MLNLIYNFSINILKGENIMDAKDERLDNLTKESSIDSNLASTIFTFLYVFKIKKFLKECGMSAFNGYKAYFIFACVFILSFLHDNIYSRFVVIRDKFIQKDAIYGFLKVSRHNWELFTRKIAKEVYNFINPLSSEEKLKVLVLDDSDYDKSTSKHVELLATIYDHVRKKTIKGFKFLALAWTDGESTFPVDGRLMSSANEELRNAVKEEKANLDVRSNGAKRRAEAIKTKLEVGYRMIVDSLKIGIKAAAVVFDSWFAFPCFIIKCASLLPVVCRMKMAANVQYIYKGKKRCASAIYRMLKKRVSKNKPVSVIVEIEDTDGNKIKVKLVFLLNRATNDLITMISTDTSFSSEKIIRIYGLRWSIFF